MGRGIDVYVFTHVHLHMYISMILYAVYSNL